MCGVDVAQCGVNYDTVGRKVTETLALLAQLDRASVF
jgi:hypothetical protein